MARKIKYTLAAVALICAFTQCSTKKNTWATRSYHYVTARYNVYFNAKQSYMKGVEAVKDASVDDYNQILDIYPGGDQAAANAGLADMKVVVEKCQKGIKLHSIVKKPKKNAARRNDPAYQAFMAKEEYNPMVQQCWLLMGMAQYQSMDYMAALATLGYAVRHFPDNRDVSTMAKIYMARCYNELGWFYESEDLLNKMGEADFIPKTNRMYVLARADLLLRQKQYKAAIPFLQTAIKNEKGELKSRLMFIYGQVLEEQGRFGEAFDQYKACINSNPPHQMEFNSFLNMARCYEGGNTGMILAQLARLLKKQSNDQYKDQIYYAMGELYARNGDEAKAVEFYQKAVDESTRNGIDKAKALLALGGIHFDKKEFVEAQPMYGEALPLLPLDFDGYNEISLRSTYLNDVARNQNTIILEDSLQALAALPEDERVEKIKKVIEEEKKREEEELRRLEEEERLQAIREENAALGQQSLALGATADQSWYFYNASLVGRGKLQFRRTWGNRTLEDNWRRSDKTSGMMFGFDDYTSYEDSVDEYDEAEETVIVMTHEDSIADGDGKLAEYLKAVPTTDGKMQASNARIEDALYALFVSFESDLRDYELAEETLAELARRFPDSKYLPEIYYRRYGMYNRAGETALSEESKQLLLSRYPDSQYAKIVKYGGAQDGTSRDERVEQLYRKAYAAFVQGDSHAVGQYAAQAREMYPDAKLMPKFEFLDIVSHGKQDGREKFAQRLNELIAKYPDNEIVSVARGMAALAAQGKEVMQTVPTAEAITESRNERLVSKQEFAENIEKAGFVYDPADRHAFVVMAECGEDKKNEILFAIATYNFSRFLIKDFGLQVRPLGEDAYAIVVSGLENLDEAVWYRKSLMSDSGLQASLAGTKYKAFPISDTNLRSVIDKETADRYIEFYQSNNLEIDESETKKIRENTGFVSEQSPAAVDSD